MFGGLGEYKWFYWLYFISMAFNSYWANVARGLNQIKLITVASIVSSLVSALSAGLFIGFWGWKVDGYFVSLILGGISATVVYVLTGKSWKYVSLPRKQTYRFLKMMLLYSVPLIPNSIFGGLGRA